VDLNENPPLLGASIAAWLKGSSSSFSVPPIWKFLASASIDCNSITRTTTAGTLRLCGLLRRAQGAWHLPRRPKDFQKPGMETSPEPCRRVLPAGLGLQSVVGMWGLEPLCPSAAMRDGSQGGGGSTVTGGGLLIRERA